MNGIKSNRRGFLKVGLGSAGILLAANPVANALGDSCLKTPPQTSGPFYPGEGEFSVDGDLTQISGHSQRALGQIIYVVGRVQGIDCLPVAGANVEIWQACASGKYNNLKDPNPAPIDPNFKYWGEVFTDANGEYQFKTIIPGAYPADTDWVRPPHIHFKVTKIGFEELTTQMYFKGDPNNETDLILRRIPESERSSVVVDFRPSAEDLEPRSLTGRFDITIKSIR